MNKRFAIFLVMLASVVLLSGCLVPERFTAKVDVQPDASYTFSYSGTAIHALAAAQIKQSGPLSAKDQNGLRAQAEELLKSPGVRKAIYRGDGRYELEIASANKAGQSMKMFDIFFVNTGKDGVMTIASIEIKEKNKRDLEQLGIALNGTLEVRLPKNVEIISHNATSAPTLGFGSYSWKIGRIDQRPIMKVKFIGEPAPTQKSSRPVPHLTIVSRGDNAPESLVRVLTSTAVSSGKYEITVAGGPCMNESGGRSPHSVDSSESVAKGDLFFMVPDLSGKEGFALRRANSAEIAKYRSCNWR